MLESEKRRVSRLGGKIKGREVIGREFDKKTIQPITRFFLFCFLFFSLSTYPPFSLVAHLTRKTNRLQTTIYCAKTEGTEPRQIENIVELHNFANLSEFHLDFRVSARIRHSWSHVKALDE